MKRDADETFVIILFLLMIITFIFGMPVLWWLIIPSEFWRGFLIGAHITLILCWLIFD